MPTGPGPRQRRATKIANRSHVTPFDRLAQWNAQIMNLGAQGSIPSIVGNTLQFVKLNASSIPGIMDNPATEDLIMGQWDILFSANGNIGMTNGIISGVSTLSSSNNLQISSQTSTLVTGGRFEVQPVLGAEIKLQCASTGGVGPINIVWPDTLDANGYNITIGGNRTSGSCQVNIMNNNYNGSASFLQLGSSTLGSNRVYAKQIDIDAGTNGLQMGSDGGVTIDATNNIEIDAGNRLDLSGNQIFIDSDGTGGVNISSANAITMDATNIDIDATATLDLSSTNLNAIAGASNLSMSDLATVLSTKTTTFNATGVITLDAPLNATGGIRLKVGSSSSTQLALSAVSMQLISPEIKIGTSTSTVDISGETTIGNLTAQDISCNQLFTGRLVDLSNNGRFTLQDTNTGPASNKVINTDASGAGGVLFGGYDYTSTTNPIATPTIGGKNAIERVVIDLEAGSNNFNNLVANSGSVITTKGGIKILPLQTGTGGAQGSAWGASLFLGEYGFGNYPTPVVARSQSTGSGDFRPGSGNVYCNAIRQNVVYSNSNVTSQGLIGTSWVPGTYQGFAANSMYFNGGDVRYLIIDPRNGTNGKATVILPAISEPMLGQAITVVRTTVSSKFNNYDACVLIQSAAAPATDRINCPHSIFVDYNPSGAISIDPYDKGVDLSNNGIITALPTPYKSTEICSVTLVASQNGYFNTNLNGASDSSEITTQFVWQFISSGGPGV